MIDCSLTMSIEPGRVKYNLRFLPPHLFSEFAQVNKYLEEQLDKFVLLARRFNRLHESEAERTFNFAGYGTKMEADTLRSIEGDVVPPLITEILERFGIDFAKPLGMRIMLHTQLEDAPDPKFTTPYIDILFSNDNFQKGMRFRTGFFHYAHKSTVNYGPSYLGYFHEITRLNTSAISDDEFPIKVFLNGPEYSSVRWKIFDELYDWLDAIFG